ncbi:hypothetical protein HMPREF3203_03755 [Proteus mirabilis]|nr:hypothetical protein HMPREF3203_03755 [Proteus mirabilis]
MVAQNSFMGGLISCLASVISKTRLPRVFLYANFVLISTRKKKIER